MNASSWRILAALALVAIASANPVVAQPDRPRIFAPPTKREAPPQVPQPRRIPLDVAHDAVRSLLETLEQRHAYSVLVPPDPQAHAQALSVIDGRKQSTTGDDGSISEWITRLDLEDALAHVIAHTIDGHASVHARNDVHAGKLLPVLLEPLEDATRLGPSPILALHPDRTPLDPERPLLVAIDGVPIERWMDAASARLPRGTRTLRERFACMKLINLQDFRRFLDIEDDPFTPNDATLTLADADGLLPTSTITLPLRAVVDTIGPWPLRKSAMIDEHIAYLRVPSMIGDVVGLREHRRVLDSFKDAGAKALIIDLRNNGGGARAMIPLLADALLPAGHDPIAFTASRILRTPGVPDVAYLDKNEYRELVYRDDVRLSDAHRLAIDRFLEGFTPRLPVPDDRFTPLAFGLLTPAGNGRTPVIDGPVIALMNGGCFSAADVCLAALAEFPTVTLMGQPSAGGSGFAEMMPISGGLATARLSTMATFRRDGSLIDGEGIQPDVLVAPPITDSLKEGTDHLLDTAVEWLHLRLQVQ